MMSGIYIHIPYCKKACDYCNFHFSVSLRQKTELIEAICQEIELRKNYLGSDEIESVYFGGGTPSILEISEIEKVLNQIRKYFTLKDGAEISLEANPDDLQSDKVFGFKDIGITRFSIGIQSFNQEDLKFLGRIHTAKESTKAIENVLKANFNNTTIDLIYGIPGSNEKRWKSNLNFVKDFGIPHLSAYSLTVEQKTPYHNKINKGLKANVDDELLCDQYYELKNFAKTEGFEHYEISNFAKPGFESIHNTNYWRNKKYLGVGPSAHSFDGESRQWNLAINSKYIDAIKNHYKFYETEVLTPKDRYNEFVMISLRTKWGLDLNQLFKIYNEAGKEKLLNKIEYYINMDFLKMQDQIVTLTDEGILFSDQIISELFIV